MKVNYNNKSSVETIEMNLLMKIPEKSSEDDTGPAKDRGGEELRDRLAQPHAGVADHGNPCGIKTSGVCGLSDGACCHKWRSESPVRQRADRCRKCHADTDYGRFCRSRGLGAQSLWLLIDLAGPAYRVTLPSCILLPTCARSIFIHLRILTF